MCMLEVILEISVQVGEQQKKLLGIWSAMKQRNEGEIRVKSSSRSQAAFAIISILKLSNADKLCICSYRPKIYSKWQMSTCFGALVFGSAVTRQQLSAMQWLTLKMHNGDSYHSSLPYNRPCKGYLIRAWYLFPVRTLCVQSKKCLYFHCQTLQSVLGRDTWWRHSTDGHERVHFLFLMLRVNMLHP